jgi:signal transduction histidine kinase
LLSNAAKFSPSDRPVLVSAQRHGGVVRITVTDRGSGIPEEFRARIFERFAQADSSTTREKGGTGLGLSISKAIVERMGGHIGFETEVGAGTTFYVELPFTEQSPEGARA